MRLSGRVIISYFMNVEKSVLDQRFTNFLPFCHFRRLSTNCPPNATLWGVDKNFSVTIQRTQPPVFCDDKRNPTTRTIELPD